MRGNGFRRFRRESEIIQGAFPALLVAWTGGRIPVSRCPGLGEGRHRSRLRPSEALDPQGTPGPLSRVRERVGGGPPTPHFKTKSAALKPRLLRLAVGEVVVLRVAIEMPTRYGRGHGLGREGLYTANSSRSVKPFSMYA